MHTFLPSPLPNFGRALKERRNGHAGKRSSKHLKMDNNKLSTKNPQLDSPGKIHTYWIKATCDSRLSVLDVSEQKFTLWSSQTDCQYTAPLIGTKLPRTTTLCFNFIIFIWNRTRGPPMKTRMDSSKHSEAICVRDARQESAIFLDNLSGQEVYSPKPANGLSKKP